MTSGDEAETAGSGRGAHGGGPGETPTHPGLNDAAAFEDSEVPGPPSTPAGSAPGYREWPFVRRWINTPAGPVPQVETRLTWEDTLGAWRVRWGVGRRSYRVSPGLYAVGAPREDAPVLVTANDKLTFDALRSELSKTDAWILALDTRGISVWCAAAQGTFGVDEVARRVRVSKLERVVSHRVLILPQLAAVGVSAEEVRRACGFSVIFGPVRAADAEAFLGAGKVATSGMRQVTFPWRERLALVPMELTNKLAPSRWIIPGLLVAGGLGPGIFSFRGALVRGAGAVFAYLLGVAAGSVVTPVLLPWLPGRAFSYKGAVTGLAAALGAILLFWGRMGWSDRFALLPSVAVTSSFCAMLFTGATTFTSPSGVEKEMRWALKYQVGGLLFAALVWIGSRF